ncbi:MAG: 50S ribosomal protein L35 [Candidatus Methylacidiphilales bacterium]
MRKASSSKTRKAVAKRFKVTASGKVKASQSGRRHLAASKNRKRKRNLAMPKMLDESDAKRMKQCLPFG